MHTMLMIWCPMQAERNPVHRLTKQGCQLYLCQCLHKAGCYRLPRWSPCYCTHQLLQLLLEADCYVLGYGLCVAAEAAACHCWCGAPYHPRMP